jgi:hypothetical protein
MTGPARARVICSSAAVAAALAAGTAGASGPAPTQTASRTLITYGKSVTLTGHVSGAGTVMLQANPFPFHGGFRTIATRHAGPGGDYSFEARPSHANRYRVVFLRGATVRRSAAMSVYVDDRVLALSCDLCMSANTSGPHTLTVHYEALAPPGKVAVRGPVYFYYGLLDGTSPPASVALVKRVALHRKGHTLSYTVTYAVDFPVTAFQFRVAACFRNAEKIDGVGLPGHQHCGDRTLTRRQYLGYLG